MIDLLGHVGYLLLLAGTIMVARRIPAGWALRMSGNLLWIVLGFALGLTSVILWGAVFTIIEFRSFRRWRREAQ